MVWLHSQLHQGSIWFLQDCNVADERLAAREATLLLSGSGVAGYPLHSWPVNEEPGSGDSGAAGGSLHSQGANHSGATRDSLCG